VYLSISLNHKRAFEETDIASDVVAGFLNRSKMPFEADPDQRWISTDNTRAAVISKFFKCLNRPNELPAATLRMLKQINQKGPKSSIKATDLWSREEDTLFLKSCEDLLIACYHAMSRDCSARPSKKLG
jgi:integrase/recombinase XerD